MQQESSVIRGLYISTFTNEDDSYIDRGTAKGNWIQKHGRGNMLGWPHRITEDGEFSKFVRCIRAVVEHNSVHEGIALSLTANFSHENSIEVERNLRKKEFHLGIRFDGRFLDLEDNPNRVRYSQALVLHALKYQMLVLKHFHSSRLLAYLDENPIAPDIQAWLDQVSANWDYALSAAGRAEERLRDELRQRAVSLYKKEGNAILFAQSYALDDQKAYLLHGKVGEKGTQISQAVAAGQTVEQLLFDLVKPFHQQKYKRLKEQTLILEMDVAGDEADAVKRQHAMAEALDEWSGWNGLGSVEGSSIGSGTMEIFFNVCDATLGEKLLHAFFVEQGWSGIRLKRDD
jgi:hypothetical protein